MNTSSSVVWPADKQLIGISGTFAGGKDTLAHYLEKELAFSTQSSSDFVRKLSMERHGSIERPLLRETADHYRKTYGAGAMVDIIVKDFLNNSAMFDGLVITGLRSLGETKSVHALGGRIIFVDAPIELRYERMKARARDDETLISLDEFATREESEMYAGPTDADFNLRGIKQSADAVVENVSSLDDFLSQSRAALDL